MQRTAIVTATVLALGTAIISGVSNFIAKISVTVVKDPILFTSLKNGIVAVLLLGVILIARQRRELRTLKRRQWLQLIAIGVIGGSIPFALFFTGLTHTTALNASLIHKTLFLWVAVLAIWALRERLTAWHWAGIGLVGIANFFVGGFTGFRFNAGEAMILAATVLWAVENVIAKKTLAGVSSLTVAAARMVFGSLLLSGFALLRGGGEAVTQLNAVQWGWTAASSLLLMGYVITWYAALKRAPATYVATLLVPATLVTNALSAIFLTRNFPLVQIVNALLLGAGIAVMIIVARRSPVALTPERRPVIDHP